MSRRARRLLLHTHSIASSFVDALLGFGFAALMVPGAVGTGLGIVAAAGIDSVLGKAIDFAVLSPSARALDDADSRFDLTLIWFLTMLATAVLLTPVSALLAPHYALHGLFANVSAIVLVYGATILVGRASPWGRGA